LSVNQQNVATTLTSFFDSTGKIPTAFAMLTPAELTMASGELGTAVIQIRGSDLFLDLLFDPAIVDRSGTEVAGQRIMRFASQDGESLDYSEGLGGSASEREARAIVGEARSIAPTLDHWSVWAAPFGRASKTTGNTITGSQDSSYQLYGLAVGVVDYRVSAKHTRRRGPRERRHREVVVQRLFLWQRLLIVRRLATLTSTGLELWLLTSGENDFSHLAWFLGRGSSRFVFPRRCG
jgi:hypothetical protein